MAGAVGKKNAGAEFAGLGREDLTSLLWKDLRDRAMSGPPYDLTPEAEVRLSALLDLGAETDFKDKDGFTPLHLLAMARVSSVELIRRAATPFSLSAGDRLGRTALFYAAERAPAAVVELLLTCGAGADQEDQEGVTPLLAAAGLHARGGIIKNARDEARRSCELLAAYGADPGHRMKCGAGLIVRLKDYDEKQTIPGELLRWVERLTGRAPDADAEPRPYVLQKANTGQVGRMNAMIRGLTGGYFPEFPPLGDKSSTIWLTPDEYPLVLDVVKRVMKDKPFNLIWPSCPAF